MQLSFFDHAMQYQGGKKSMKFLNAMKEIIPFDNLEKILIEEGIYKPTLGKKGGRPSMPERKSLIYEKRFSKLKLGNDTDTDGGLLVVTNINTPKHSTTNIDKKATINYSPDNNFTETDYLLPHQVTNINFELVI